MAVATEKEYGLFIDGELVEPASGEVRDLTEPASGASLAKAAMAGPDDVDRAVAAARTALAGPWGKTPPNERSRLLHALADALQENRKEVAELETRNVGKAIVSVKAELAQAVENLRFYGSARWAARFSRTRSRSPSASAHRSCRGTTRSCSPRGSLRPPWPRAAPSFSSRTPPRR
jgi:acyl-CoA reductase-like NAD-dependent aldehyde dehydrogenase